ncbi:MAG: flagellar hook-basal body complex protein FliE [Pseudomonadota bacterium]|nr:flagellar hook-basal body complex protein FliE [Pseudomonadota bacterium]
MDVTALSSVGGLGATARSTQVAPSAAASGPSFTEMLGQVIAGGVNTIQAGESAAIQGLSGAAPAFKVVESVMAAQRTLQEGLSIRDKVVSAYQEIARMTI